MMKAAISFEHFRGSGPLMVTKTQTLGRGGVLAALVALNSLCLPAHADDNRSKEQSKQQVEFGIQVARQGLWKEAIFRWQKAVELDPGNPSARNNLAVAYEQDGQFELAEQEYERALELNGSNTFIRQNYELFREAYEKRKRKERNNDS
jgi:type IV pilus assembly protein PilF